VTVRRPVVFVGPSLADEAVSWLDGELRPPIKDGDVDALLVRDEPPAAIGIIDGAVLHRTSISPKEVVRAIDHGIAVFGSSGVGALRAVECAPYGMIGIGRIYQEYQSGRIDADDEVAVVYDPATHRALSEPLVNMRFAMAAAVSRAVATKQTADRFLEIAKSLYFPQRSVATVLPRLAAEINEAECAALARFLAEDAPNAAREDAIALLDAMTRALSSRGA